MAANTYTLEDARRAVAFNKERGLYAGDPDHLRIYFTYRGGKYNGQRGHIKSEYQLEQAAAYEGSIDEIEIIGEAEAWREYFTNGIKEQKNV